MFLRDKVMKVSAAARGKARHYAMQAIYQWEMTGNSLHSIESEFHADNNMAKVDTDYFSENLHGVAANKTQLDTLLKPNITNMGFEEVDPVSLAVLRQACFELKERIDVPYKVVINEAVNLAKKFGATDSHKFINGVLDKVALQTREVEVSAMRAKK